MILYVFSTRDRAADVFSQPFFSPTKGTAIRSFSDEINRVDVNNMLNKHPDDFDLYYLGTYDDNTGLFDVERPSQVAVGKDLLLKSMS